MIYVCEHHDQLLSLWQRLDARKIALAHVDFHDDLRGLLIDRRRGVAYPIGSLARGEAEADPGNFLAHAVLEGRLERVRWVHGLPGGRAWDLGIVRYETDLFAWRERRAHARRGGAEIALEFEELLIEQWSGPVGGDWLSIDWDCFASILLDPDGVSRRVGEFVERLGPGIPSATCVCYSPEYSHPSHGAFVQLVDALADRYDQPVEWLSPELASGRTHPTDVDAGLPGGWLPRAILLLRRMGIY